MPASNVIRVRSDGFSKNMATCLPASAVRKSSGRVLTRFVSETETRALGRQVPHGDEVANSSPSSESLAAVQLRLDMFGCAIRLLLSTSPS